MATKSLRQKAVDGINQHGALLVYPIKNKKAPASVWSVLYPRTEMRWSWDDDADNRVSKVWYLKEELSRSNEVVYGKWFKNRATFLSFPVFIHLRAYLREVALKRRESREMLEILQMDSPISTKQLKEEMQLQGRILEPLFQKAQRELFEKLELVGFGEVNDSAFPSMAMGASSVIFEDLCHASDQVSFAQAEKFLGQIWPEGHPMAQYAQKLRQKPSNLV